MSSFPIKTKFVKFFRWVCPHFVPDSKLQTNKMLLLRLCCLGRRQDPLQIIYKRPVRRNSVIRQGDHDPRECDELELTKKRFRLNQWEINRDPDLVCSANEIPEFRAKDNSKVGLLWFFGWKILRHNCDSGCSQVEIIPNWNFQWQPNHKKVLKFLQRLNLPEELNASIWRHYLQSGKLEITYLR